MKPTALLIVLLVALTSSASEVPLATVSSSTTAPATYVATAGAALKIQCPGQIVRYAPGNSGSPPTAASGSAQVDFTAAPLPYPIQLSPSQDRISILGTGTGLKCFVFTDATPPLTTTAATMCLVLNQTVVAVGLTSVAVPTSAQAGRRYLEVCISGENAGTPKVKCLVDATPVMGATHPGDVLQITGLICHDYAVDTTHTVNCISDTASTGTLTSECVAQ